MYRPLKTSRTILLITMLKMYRSASISIQDTSRETSDHSTNRHLHHGENPTGERFPSFVKRPPKNNHGENPTGDPLSHRPLACYHGENPTGDLLLPRQQVTCYSLSCFLFLMLTRTFSRTAGIDRRTTKTSTDAIGPHTGKVMTHQLQRIRPLILSKMSTIVRTTR